MAMVRYTKQRPAVYQPKERVRQKKAFERRLFWLHRMAPVFLVSIGLMLLGSVIIPIFSAQLQNTTDIEVDAREEIEPLSKDKALTSILAKKENLLPTPYPTPIVITTELDYTDLSNWFPEQQLPVIAPQEEKKYFISIPKVNIQDAEVVYGGRNLDQHLIHYPGTAMPGELGSPVLFGHSVLRQFYNPAITNPRRYISIFSTIMTLKVGDEILVRDGAVTYTYRVKSKTEVKPTDTFILEQNTNSREIKLVTCTPEGTTLRRGVVTAVLEE